MTAKNALLSLIIALTLFGCKSENTEVLFDCQKTITNYSSTGEMENWLKGFYLNRRIARVESSTGNFYVYKYDGNGNPTLYETNDTKIEMNYNFNNQIIKKSFFFQGQLSSYEDYFYINILLDRVLQISNTGDTTIERYFYGADNQLDSVINEYWDSYYFYDTDYKRILVKGKNGLPMGELIYKYSNSILIEDESYMYDNEGNVELFFKSEFALTGKLIKRTFIDYNSSTRSYYILYHYNNFGNLEREEFYDAENNLSQYAVYAYENEILKKIESFTPQHELQMFTIVEGHCETIEPDNTNFKHSLIPQNERMFFNKEDLPSSLNPFIFNHRREMQNVYQPDMLR